MNQPESHKVIPVVIGIALTAVLLGFVAYIANVRRQAEALAVPQLAILSPDAGAAVDSPLVIRFTAEQPLELNSTGWGYRTLHLHAWVNGVQYMPAAADIVRSDSSAYLWTLPLGRGTLDLSLAWADQAHRPLTAGASETIQLRLR